MHIISSRILFSRACIYLPVLYIACCLDVVRKGAKASCSWIRVRVRASLFLFFGVYACSHRPLPVRWCKSVSFFSMYVYAPIFISLISCVLISAHSRRRRCVHFAYERHTCLQKFKTSSQIFVHTLHYVVHICVYMHTCTEIHVGVHLYRFCINVNVRQNSYRSSRMIADTHLHMRLLLTSSAEQPSSQPEDFVGYDAWLDMP